MNVIDNQPEKITAIGDINWHFCIMWHVRILNARSISDYTSLIPESLLVVEFPLKRLYVHNFVVFSYDELFRKRVI